MPGLSNLRFPSFFLNFKQFPILQQLAMLIGLTFFDHSYPMKFVGIWQVIIWSREKPTQKSPGNQEEGFIFIFIDIMPISAFIIRVTPRQLESLIRLSEAVAKLHLEEEVKISHANEAIQLFKEASIVVEKVGSFFGF